MAAWSEGLDPARNRDAVRAAQMNRGASAVLAVADGASGTLFAGVWANLLTDVVVELGETGLDGDRLIGEVARIASTYRPSLQDGNAGRWQRRKWERHGSQATLLAVRIDAGVDQASVEAMAVGDSVVVIATCDAVFAFPISDPESFGRRPQLVSSQGVEELLLERWSGSIRRGDLVLAVSDGVARPLLALAKTRGPRAIWSLVLDLIDRPGDHRAVLLERLGTTSSADGTASLEDDTTLAVCMYVPEGHTSPRDRARTVLRTRLGLEPEARPDFFDRLLERLRGWVWPQGGDRG